MSSFIAPFQMESNNIRCFRLSKNENANIVRDTKIELSVEYDIEDMTISNGSREARLSLLIAVLGENDNHEEVFDLKLVMEGVFVCDETIKNEIEFNDMIKINGVSTLIQISRAYITAVTALSGFAYPINLPMINVYDLATSIKE